MSLEDFKNKNVLNRRPDTLADVKLPLRPEGYFSSPIDWREEVFYFLLPDRFSDGKEDERTKLGSSPSVPKRWDEWAQSGGDRWQGGTLNGVRSKLSYLKTLGVTVIWVGPIFKQRANLDTYHGYGIQDFLDVDPHFGTRKDLVKLVEASHDKGLRVIIDIVFIHSGWNWDYKESYGDEKVPYRNWPGSYDEIRWLDRRGNVNTGGLGEEDGVWPSELQDFGSYTRAGEGSLAGETAHNIDDIHTEFRRADFNGHMRNFSFDHKRTLTNLAKCYKYWIALTDCDGFHVVNLNYADTGAVHGFCGTIKEFAANLGKANFFLVGELGGADENAEKYRKVLESNLNATLDIGESRVTLTAVAKGLLPASAYFDKVAAWDGALGSNWHSGLHHVVILDDHDHVFGTRVRFSSDAAGPYQVIAGIAIQLLSLGIPCIYYGTEQSLAGPPKTERDLYLPDYGHHDKYLRETMFGADHPRLRGEAGRVLGGTDASLPGFAAYGANGQHCFREEFPTFRAVKFLIRTRQDIPALRFGRQYLREIKNGGPKFEASKGGETFAWSRILDEEEVLCVINGHGTSRSSALVTVDSDLNRKGGPGFQVLFSSAEVLGMSENTYSKNQTVAVEHDGDRAYVRFQHLMPSEVLVLSNYIPEGQDSAALSVTPRSVPLDTGSDKSPYFIFDHEVLPLLQIGASDDLLEWLPPAIAIATSEKDPVGLELTTLKEMTDQEAKLLRECLNMLAWRHDGCRLPSTTVVLQECVVRISQAVGGLAITGPNHAVERLLAYWAVLVASINPNRPIPPMNGRIHSRPADALIPRKFRVVDLNDRAWPRLRSAEEVEVVRNAEIYAPVRAPGTSSLAGVLSVQDPSEAELARALGLRTSNKAAVDTALRNAGLHAANNHFFPPFTVTGSVYPEDGANCWTTLLELSSVFIRGETLHTIIEFSEQGLSYAAETKPGAMLIPTLSLGRIFPYATVGICETGDDKPTPIISIGSTIIFLDPFSRQERGQRQRIMGHVPEGPRFLAEDGPEYAQLPITLRRVKPDQEAELRDKIKELLPEFPDDILLGGEARPKPILPCWEDSWRDSLVPGLKEHSETTGKSYGAGMSASAMGFVAFSGTVGITRTKKETWYKLSKPGAGVVERLQRQAVTVVNHQQRTAIVTTGLHVALSLVRSEFESQDEQRELEQRVRDGDAKAMAVFARGRLKGESKVEGLEETLENYATSFSELSNAMIINSPDCFGFDMDEMRLGQVQIRVSPADRAAKRTWIPIGRTEGPVLFVPKECELLSPKSSSISWKAFLHPGASEMLDKRPMFMPRIGQVVLNWSTRRMSDIQEKDDEETVYRFREKGEYFVLQREDLPPWAASLNRVFSID